MCVLDSAFCFWFARSSTSRPIVSINKTDAQIKKGESGGGVGIGEIKEARLLSGYRREVRALHSPSCRLFSPSPPPTDERIHLRFKRAPGRI